MDIRFREDNGIIYLDGDKISLKSDTNRRIYVKRNAKQLLQRPYVSTGVFLPHNLTLEQKKSYLFELYNLCVMVLENENEKTKNN